MSVKFTEPIAGQGLARYHCGMKWKHTVHAALIKAQEDGRIPRIAEETGITADRLYQFGNKKSINTDDAFLIDAWLIANGYKEPTTPASLVAGKGGDPVLQSYFRLVINDLKALLTTLEAPDIDEESKASELKTFIAAYTRGRRRADRVAKEKKGKS